MSQLEIFDENFEDDNTRESYKNVLFVDPGLGGTGLAFWVSLAVPYQNNPQPPRRTHLITAMRKLSWTHRAQLITDEFSKFLRKWKPAFVIIESQEVWSTSEKSLASATKGDLFKTSILTGMLVRETSIQLGVQVELLSPLKWKGQLSKKAVFNRLRRAFGKKLKFQDHVDDAIGMGLYAQKWL